MRGGVKNKYRKAFTLAEVMVVIFILGVIACETMPVIIKSYQEKVSSVRVKVAYSLLYQATLGVIQDNGGTLSGAYDGTHDAGGKQKFLDDYGKYLQFVRTCEWSTRSQCYPNYYTLNGLGPSDPNGGGSYNEGRILWAIGKNGMSFRFSSNAPCLEPTDRCGFIEVDTNGFKGPNKFGKDIFIFVVYPDSIKPHGWNLTLSQ